jgi:AraC family transcriptional regulator
MTALKDTEHEWQGKLKSVATYIQTHFIEDLSIEMLAALAGNSVSQFKRNFTKVFEMSPGRFIVNTRINHARKLLETTDMLLSDIALESGFYDQSHMTKAFKTIRKTTPGEYRRKHRLISSSNAKP